MMDFFKKTTNYKIIIEIFGGGKDKTYEPIKEKVGKD